MASKQTDGTADHNRILINEIGFIDRSLERLVERFEVEKQDALDSGGIKHIKKLLDRSRTFFQPETAALLNRLFMARSRIRQGEYDEKTRLLSEKVEKTIREASSHFVSAPHRLMRNLGLGPQEKQPI